MRSKTWFLIFDPSGSLTPSFLIPSMVRSFSVPLCVFSTSFSYFKCISHFSAFSLFFKKFLSKTNLSAFEASKSLTMLGKFTSAFLASQNLFKRMPSFLQLLVLMSSGGTKPFSNSSKISSQLFG